MLPFVQASFNILNVNKQRTQCFLLRDCMWDSHGMPPEELAWALGGAGSQMHEVQVQEAQSALAIGHGWCSAAVSMMQGYVQQAEACT